MLRGGDGVAYAVGYLPPWVLLTLPQATTRTAPPRRRRSTLQQGMQRLRATAFSAAARTRSTAQRPRRRVYPRHAAAHPDTLRTEVAPSREKARARALRTPADAQTAARARVRDPTQAERLRAASAAQASGTVLSVAGAHAPLRRQQPHPWRHASAAAGTATSNTRTNSSRSRWCCFRCDPGGGSGIIIVQQYLGGIGAGDCTKDVAPFAVSKRIQPLRRKYHRWSAQLARSGQNPIVRVRPAVCVIANSHRIAYVVCAGYLSCCSA